MRRAKPPLIHLLITASSVGLFVSMLGSCGATPFPGAPVSVQEPTFTAVANTILGPACLSCHNANDPRGGVDLSTYQAVMTSPGSVVPYQPYQSQLFSQCYSGRMPREAARLSATQLQLIYDWISYGATNN